MINPIIVYEKGGVTMKREYSTPAMRVEVFEASESVAACYTINCNTGKGILFSDNNNNGKYDGREELIYQNYIGYHGCGKRHEAAGLPDGGLTYNAYFQDTDDGKISGKLVGDPYPVFYWEERNRWGRLNDVHFSRLGTEDWFKNPNAS